MIELVKTDRFEAWLTGLKDKRAVARIVTRLDMAEAGNFGDCGPVGEGVSEMRIHCGPGYRIYYKGKVMSCICSSSEATSRAKRKISNSPFP
jgi:putative addiction module killer protein